MKRKHNFGTHVVIEIPNVCFYVEEIKDIDFDDKDGSVIINVDSECDNSDAIHYLSYKINSNGEQKLISYDCSHYYQSRSYFFADSEIKFIVDPKLLTRQSDLNFESV